MSRTEGDVQRSCDVEEKHGDTAPETENPVIIQSNSSVLPNVMNLSNASDEFSSNTRIAKTAQQSYTISPIHSNESDVDDSYRDPDFVLQNNAKKAKSVSDMTSKSSISCSSSSSSESTSSSSECEAINNAGVMQQEKGEKKRARKPENWYSKVTKKLRNSGKSYVTSSKSKKQFPEKKIRPPCGEKCRIGCSKKISEATRQELFTFYWNLANLQKQREYIARHTVQIKPKYRYSSTQNFRNLNSAIYFELNGTPTRVCKTFFKATLDLNDRPIRTALSKKTDIGLLEGDMRGKHGKHHTVDPEMKESVRNFIMSIPRIESHYLRAQTQREFIDSGKSLADLYRDYKESREQMQLQFANMGMFSRIFNGCKNYFV